MAQIVNTTRVTVLMPVYNGEKYLREAIDSILQQTFTDFEFLIISDGSTDNSAAIIESYNDGRIRVINNEKNIGLVNSLNKGIGLAKGEYIARMDCDDICKPDRLQKELEFLDANSDYAVVATNVVFINADGKETGAWEDDIITKNFEEIKSVLPHTNCIAHPTVMMRKAIVEKYKFHNNQLKAEDWDLWMRMVSDDIKIGKINEVLLKYRIHPLSATNLNNTGKYSQEKIIRTKRNFLVSQLLHLKINSFFFKVFYSYIRSNARWIKIYLLPEILRTFKRLLTTNPIKVFIDYTRLKRYLNTNTHNLIFFFPYTFVGGAERVHADIVECMKDEKPLVFFTGFSYDDAFLKLYETNAKVFNIPQALNYPILGKRIKQLLASYINKQTKPITLGSNSIFYYELLALLNQNVYCIDLKHSFIPNDEAEKIFIPQIFRLNKRVFISKVAIENATKFYHDNNIPNVFLQRFQYIPNYVNIPKQYPPKKSGEKLSILYVGRSSPEKRVYLVAQLAVDCHLKKIPVSFQLIGDLKNVIDKTAHQHIAFTGKITNQNELYALYKKADILLITSTTEGFPMVIMEAMANGVVPISTKVGDVPMHIKNNKTGFVTSSNEDNDVIKQMTEYIKLLSDNRELLSEMSLNAYNYAKENFSKENFINGYHSLLRL